MTNCQRLLFQIFDSDHIERKETILKSYMCACVLICVCNFFLQAQICFEIYSQSVPPLFPHFFTPSGRHNVNYNTAVRRLVASIPAGVDYIRCINCWCPIAFADEVTETLYANRFPDIAIAHAIRLYPFSFPLFFTSFSDLSRIYWQTRVNCNICKILLSIPSLTIFNTVIDEYTNDGPCIILDASSVELQRNS